MGYQADCYLIDLGNVVEAVAGGRVVHTELLPACIAFAS